MSKKKGDRKKSRASCDVPTHPVIGHVGVSLTEHGNLQTVIPEGRYSFATFIQASMRMQLGTRVSLPTVDGKEHSRPVESNWGLYQINNEPDAHVHMRATELSFRSIQESDSIGKKDNEKLKWSPDEPGAKTVHFRIADRGTFYGAGVPAYAWKHGTQTRPLLMPTKPTDSSEEEVAPKMLYVVGQSNATMANNPYVRDFIPTQGFASGVIVAHDDFAKNELADLKDVTTTEDGKTQKAEEIRKQLRNLIYVNGFGTLDGVFSCTLFPTMAVLTGFARADMLYRPSDNDLPTAYEIALGEKEKDNVKARRNFLKSYLVEDFMRHFSFKTANPKFDMEMKGIHKVEQPELNEAALTARLFGEFKNHFMLARLFRSQSSYHCVRIKNVAHLLSDLEAAVEDNNDNNSEQKDRASNTSNADASRNPSAAAADVKHSPASAPAPAPSATTATSATQQELSQTLYGAVECRPHYWWTWSLQKIPRDVLNIETQKEDPQTWQWIQQRLVARRIEALWFHELQSDLTKLKIPPGHEQPIIYQEDVRNFIAKFAHLRLGVHYFKRRSLDPQFGLWSAFPCPGQSDKRHDHAQCGDGLYMHHVIDDLPFPMPKELLQNKQHPLMPLFHLLARAEYQATERDYRDRLRKAALQLESAETATAVQPSVAAAAVTTRPKKTNERRKEAVSHARKTEVREDDAKLLRQYLSQQRNPEKLNQQETTMLFEVLQAQPSGFRARQSEVDAALHHMNPTPLDATIDKLLNALHEARRSINEDAAAAKVKTTPRHPSHDNKASARGDTSQARRAPANIDEDAAAFRFALKEMKKQDKYGQYPLTPAGLNILLGALKRSPHGFRTPAKTIARELAKDQSLTDDDVEYMIDVLHDARDIINQMTAAEEDVQDARPAASRTESGSARGRRRKDGR